MTTNVLQFTARFLPTAGEERVVNWILSYKDVQPERWARIKRAAFLLEDECKKHRNELVLVEVERRACATLEAGNGHF